MGPSTPLGINSGANGGSPGVRAHDISKGKRQKAKGKRQKTKPTAMAEYQILYWRDLPAQFRVYEGKRARSYKLAESYQVEIDLVAMREGVVDTEAYLDGWQWSERAEMAGTPDEVVEQLKVRFDG